MGFFRLFFGIFSAEVSRMNNDSGKLPSLNQRIAGIFGGFSSKFLLKK